MVVWVKFREIGPIKHHPFRVLSGSALHMISCDWTQGADYQFDFLFSILILFSSLGLANLNTSITNMYAHMHTHMPSFHPLYIDFKPLAYFLDGDSLSQIHQAFTWWEEAIALYLRKNFRLHAMNAYWRVCSPIGCFGSVEHYALISCM